MPKRKREATKEQVRAWLSTVIAPLRAGLGLELQFLGSNSDHWKVEGAKFLALRDRPPLADSFQALLRDTRTLHDSAERLFAGLGATQEDLADQFGLPPVDPTPLGAT